MHASAFAHPQLRLVFIGGGNMASAILGGLIKEGLRPDQVTVVAPTEATRARLSAQFGVHTLGAAGPELAGADVVVWAVKPQVFHEASLPVVPHTPGALHLSVAAGITTETLARWLGTDRVVRCMPNTPSLIGQGMSGLYAAPGATAADRELADALLHPTGKLLWVKEEAQLDAVTAISGSGPAYVFYWIEALMQGGVELGLSEAESRELAAQTLAGAAALVQASDETPDVLRARVTSKGGTTHEAITSMQQHQVGEHIVEAMRACWRRAREMAAQYR